MHTFSRSLILFFLLLSACSGNGSPDAVTENDLEEVSEEVVEEAAAPVIEEKKPQDRNGPCAGTSDCLLGLTCSIAPGAAAGTCQELCQRDSDCGNGALCRDGGCQKDCSGIGEKCSEVRVCCFFDEDGDRKTDAACTDIDGDMRCRVTEE